MNDLSASRAFLDTIAEEFDHALTDQWWTRLLKDEAAMNRWLAKLWRTEHGGYADNNDAIARYQMDPESREYKIYSKTGDDELIHAGILSMVLSGRSIRPVLEEQPESLYWNFMNPHIRDIESCSAVFAMGEQLAAVRFRVIAAHPGTPSDIMAFLNKALPDETYHAKAFAALATPEAMKAAYEQHKIAVELLKG